MHDKSLNELIEAIIKENEIPTNNTSSIDVIPPMLPIVKKTKKKKKKKI